MKRGLLLVGWLISVSACDFDTEYERIWCVRHPTTPKCVDGGIQSDAGSDAGEVDAGEVDAGELDAGGPDAGQVDAGRVLDAGEMDAGEMDAGGPCTSRRLVFDAADGGEAGLCTPVTVRVVCDDGSPSSVTHVTQVTLTSEITGIGSRGQFFIGSTCNVAAGPQSLLSQQHSLPLFFKSTTGGNPAFGRYVLGAAASVGAGEVIAPASHTLEQYAGLTFGTSGVINVPIDGGCIGLPALALRSAAGEVVAPAALPINWPPPSGFAACVSGGMTLAAGVTLDAGIQISADTASSSAETMTVITVEPLVRPATIQVRACLAQGATNDDRLCCNGATAGACD